ncbi:hypothetical protein TNCV_2329501 [Trichonephila clavipes]|nr:hypothetical protein TNCV_2329501 [Trichonephila clavipes]
MVRNHFLDTYPGREIEHFVFLPPRSPYLNPLDLILKSHLKSPVYETSLATSEDLTERIIVASADIATTLDSLERVRQSVVVGCAMTNHGRNFEKFVSQSLALRQAVMHYS